MCFAVTRGEADYRLDVAYNNPFSERVALSVFPHKLLKELVHSFSGGTPSKAEASYWAGEIPWVSPKDFRGFYISGSEDHISKEGCIAAGLTLVPAGSVLVVVRSGILKHTLPIGLTTVPVTVNQDLKALIPKGEVSGDFLANYLSIVGNKLLSYITKHSTTVQSVNTTELDLLSIPVPPLDVQQALVADMDAAREARQATLARADGLLSGLDGYLLEQLGLTAPAGDKRRAFAVRLSDVGRRCDSDYHSPHFRRLREAIEQSGYSVVSIGDICQTMQTGFAAGRGDQAEEEEGGIPHIRPTNITWHGDLVFAGTKYVPPVDLKPTDFLASGEVLFNNTNSMLWVGKTAVFDSEATCACSNHVTRLVLKPDTATPHFVAALFNALRSIGLFGLLSTNFNNQAGINTQTLAALRIPLPNLAEQEIIVQEAERRGAEARRLRRQAGQDWAAAKARFERRLLGEGLGHESRRAGRFPQIPPQPGG